MDFCSTHFPYCLEKQKNGAYVVLNKRYKPIGFNPDITEQLDYKNYPVAIEIKGLNEEIAERISHNGDSNLDKIYLYDSNCIPTISSENMKKYLARLAVLAALCVDVLPNPSSTFYQWLIQQSDRDDPIGNLAGDVRGDSCFPANGDYNQVDSYLSRYGSHILEAFEEAWQEFQQQSKA